MVFSQPVVSQLMVSLKENPKLETKYISSQILSLKSCKPVLKFDLENATIRDEIWDKNFHP